MYYNKPQTQSKQQKINIKITLTTSIKTVYIFQKLSYPK